MANRILILTEDALKNVVAGLGELPAKYSHAILADIEAQISMADKDTKAYVTLVETHLAPFKHKAE